MDGSVDDLEDSPTVLVVISAQDMITKISDVIQKLLENHDSGIYINVNQPYEVLKKIFTEKNIDISNLFFLDCITCSAMDTPEKTGNCLFINSPGNLTEIGVAMGQALEMLEGDKKFVFIDSLGTFLIYNSAGTLSKFSHFLITKLQLMGVDGIFMSIEKEMDEKLISELQSFCQKTVTLK